jgi:hypothetical protein
MTMQFDSRQLGTVLAALRLWQRDRFTALRAVDMHDIATDFGALDPLEDREIDDLCESLNFEPTVEDDPDVNAFGESPGSVEEDLAAERAYVDGEREAGNVP